MLWSGRKFEEVALTVLALKAIRSKNTRASARLQITKLIGHFGALPISKITQDEWIRYVSEQQSNGRTRFFDDRKYMRQILHHALHEGLIQKKVPLPIPDLPWDVGREITQEERKRLLEKASCKLAFQIEIAWRMGLRLREMLHLRWDQFDWNRATIRLKAADVKTRRGREVAINPDLLSRFEQFFALHASPFVFPSPGDPLRPENNNKTAWRNLKRKTGISARWHDLRHTCATEMLRRSVPIHIVSRYLGMNERVLTRIYLHLNSEDLSLAARAMSDRPF